MTGKGIAGKGIAGIGAAFVILTILSGCAGTGIDPISNPNAEIRQDIGGPPR